MREHFENTSTEESSTNSSTTESSAEESSQVSEESSTNSSTPESSVEESSEISEESSEVSEESSEVSEESSEEDPLLAIFYADCEEIDRDDPMFANYTFGSQEPAPYKLDVAYAFYSYPADLRDPENPDRKEFKDYRADYWQWRADYEITVDTNIPTDTIFFEGCHAFGTAGFTNPQEIPANTPIRLLEYMGFAATYQDLLEWCDVFYCGIANLSAENNGAVFTISVCVYDENDVGRTVVTKTFTCNGVREENQ